MLFWIFFSVVALVLLALAATFLWHVFLGVPYVPTPATVVEHMIDLADLHSGDTVIDLGAGDGRFLLSAARRCSGITAIGYELVPAVWLLGWLKTRTHRCISFRLGDARKADVSCATVVFLYVAPHLMAELEKQFTAHLRPGTRVVSYTFTLPHRSPKVSIPVTPGGRPMIHLYVW